MQKLASIAAKTTRRFVFPASASLNGSVPKYPFSVYSVFKELDSPEKQLFDDKTNKVPQWVEDMTKDGRCLVQVKIGGTDQRDNDGLPDPTKREANYHNASNPTGKHWAPDEF
jgi:hypothetical protein